MITKVTFEMSSDVMAFPTNFAMLKICFNLFLKNFSYIQSIVFTDGMVAEKGHAAAMHMVKSNVGIQKLTWQSKSQQGNRQ